MQSSGERRSRCLHPLIKVRHRDLLPPVYMVRGDGRRSSSPGRGEEGSFISPSLGWGGWCSPSAVSASCGEVSALAPRSHKDAFWTREPAPVLYTPPLPPVSAHEAPSHLPIALQPPSSSVPPGPTEQTSTKPRPLRATLAHRGTEGDTARMSSLPASRPASPA